MVSSKVVLAIANMVFGLLVIAFPGFLRWLIGIWFVLSGLLALLLP